MSQWGQGQQGFQYPMQTGFAAGNPQFQQNPQFQPQFQPSGQLNIPNGGGLVQQPTGFPGQRPQGVLQPVSGFVQPQPTGFPGPAGFQHQQVRPPPVPPVPPLPPQFQQNPPSFLYAPPPQTNRLLNVSPGFGSAGLVPQQTGFPGQSPTAAGGGMLMPQMTGFVDPRLQMMSQTFMPMNTSSPFNSAGLPQLQSQSQNLVQSFQQHNQAQRGTSTQQMSWALTKSEKKSYDNIFRQWVQGQPFMNGTTAIEVFGASGLSKDDLAQIWTLADIEDRGKLNLAEFHVAMGMIYRRLNGMQIPDQLPRELIPPSRRDLDDSVDRVKDLLANETRTHSPSTTDAPVSYLKNRSFNGSSPSFDSNRDATIYKHTDPEPASVYKPRSRHVHRDTVRSRDDEDNPSADLQDLKRKVASTAQMLDRAAEADGLRTREDEELAREMSDLNYRVKRIQEDLEFNSRGVQTASRANERRRLERELLTLTHERIPELERKIKDREERKEQERRQWARDRDRANERFGRFDSMDEFSRRDARDRPYSRGEDRDRPYTDRDKPYSRGDDRPYSRGDDRSYSREDRPYSRGADEREKRDYDRPRSPPQPPPQPVSSVKRDAPPAPSPTQVSPSPSTASMSPEQRRAYLQEQAKLRIQQRMAALGVTTPSATSSLDTSVEDRLQQEKKEAEERAKAAEKQTEEREKARRDRLENEKALKEGRSTPAVPPTPTPTLAAPPPAPTPRSPASAMTKTAPKPPAPAPPKTAPPPPIRRGFKAPAPAPPAPPTPVAAPTSPAPIPEPEIDPEEEEFRAREEALRKAREDRDKARQERKKKLKEMEEKEKARQEQERKLKEKEEKEKVRQEQERKLKEMEEKEKVRQERERRLRELEEEEEAAARLEEEQYQQRMEALKDKSAKPANPPPGRSIEATSPPAPLPPVAPPAPPAPASPSPASAPALSPAEKSTNPFSRLLKEGGTTSATSASAPATPATTNGPTGVNPWVKPQTTPLSVPPPPKSPTPVSAKTDYQTAPSSAIEDNWAQENEEEGDSSDDDRVSRTDRVNMAEALFRNLVPRPPSAPPASSRPSSTPALGTSASPPPPQASPQGAPPAPPPPPAPAPPALVSPTVRPVGDHGALFASIQGGKALRPTKTIDRSEPPGSGRVLGDNSPPVHINAASANRPPSPPMGSSSVPALVVSNVPDEAPRLDKRQSVDWFADRAADLGGSPVIVDRLPATLEVDEDESKLSSIPDVLVSSDPNSSLMADIDKSVEHRVRSIYSYDGEGQEDLSFEVNLMISANPSKSGGDWWYGRLVTSGKSGLFPKNYVEVVEQKKAIAMFPYTAANSDELSFIEGETLDIVDTSEAEWWKAERRGSVFLVPAAYLEIVEALEIVERIPSVPTNNHVLPGAIPSETEHTDDSDDPDSSHYLSFDDDDDDDDDGEKAANDRTARERERQLILEDVGLIVQTDVSPPLRRKSTKRRPAPAAPHVAQKTTPKLLVSADKDLPPIPLYIITDSETSSSMRPEPDQSHQARLDDAYARYEAFKNRKAQATPNRLSVISTESSVGGASSPATSSPVGAPSISGNPHHSTRDSEGSRVSNLLHFLTRSKTPDLDGKRKSGLNISGPISVEEGSSSDGMSFGMSWTSLVDKTALDGIPPGERKRQEAIFELINTEIAYVRDLQLIVEVFYSSMLPLLSSKEITVVFANIEDILLTNTGFVSSLEQHQKDCRLYIDKIGDILLSHIPNMGVYMEYCVNQSTAIKVLQSLRDSNPELATHLQRLRDENLAVRNLDLSSYLLIPMQRITRYPLLIKQILQYTAEVGEEHDAIATARDLAERLLDHINEAIREQENHETLGQISQNLWIGVGRLDLTAPTRNMGPRRLLRQGQVFKAKSGRKLQAFLCNDIFVLTDEGVKNLYRMPIPLAHAQIKETSRSRDETTFQVIRQKPRNGETVLLRAPTPRDCHRWIQEINQASNKARHAEERAARLLATNP